MKELSYEEWIKNPKPRIMWVWHNDFEEREKRKVVYVIKDDFTSCPVLAVSEEDASFCIYCHCAEIEELKTRRMTYRELAWWLKGETTREWKHRSAGVVRGFLTYPESEGSLFVIEDILIRENGGKWHEPLVEVEE